MAAGEEAIFFGVLGGWGNFDSGVFRVWGFRV